MAKSGKITGHWGEDAVGFKWTEQDSVDDRWKLMDTGRFLSATIVTPTETTLKGIAVRVGDNNEAAVLFDTELLRLSCGWTGEFLRFDPARYGIIAPPRVAGDVVFNSPRQPGWDKVEESGKRKAESGDANSPFGFPLSAFPKHGPLPREWAKYRGLFLHGDRVVFKYTVGPKDIEVLESPWLETVAGEKFITRELDIAPSAAAAELLVASAGTNVKLVCESNVATLEHHDGMNAITVKVTAHEKPVRLKLLFPALANSATSVFKETKAETPRSQSSRSETEREASLRRLVKPGPARWTKEITTRGVVSEKKDALVVDSLTLPFDNPYKALMFVGGHDFFVGQPFQADLNGQSTSPARKTSLDKRVSLERLTYDAAICTLHGDVWLVSGIDDKLEKLTWKRFASGLFQPLGLKIVKNQIYVVGRDQITRLHDTNNDGEADFYENFNNDGQVTANGHEYVTCLETDSQGWLYFLKGNCDGKTDHDGCLLRVSPDGQKLEVVATGFRNANGLGIRQIADLVPPEHSPNVVSDDIITVAPQEGEWTPASAIFQVLQGGFYGYVPSAHRAESPHHFTPPLCWIPRLQDNSSGGQVWVPPGAWKSLSGMPLHLSYGTSRMFLVLREQLNRHDILESGSNENEAVTFPPVTSQGERAQEKNPVIEQGATVPLPLSFESGVMRGRFRRTDGHLYVSGLRGWVSNAAKDACFQRVRFTGEPFDLPVSITAFPNGVLLKFSDRLDPQTAEDPDNYRVQQWNYRWSAAYGSPEFKVSNPSQEGRDEVEVLSATLLPPQWGHAVFVELSNVQPVNQLSIQMTLKSAEGRPIERRVDATINAIRRDLFQFDKKPPKARPGQLADEVRERLVPGLRLRVVPTSDQKAEVPRERLLRMAAWQLEPQDVAPQFSGLKSQISNLKSQISKLTLSADGYIVAPRRGRYLFSIDGNAPAELSISDRVIWQSKIGQPNPTASEIELARGFNKLRIVQRVSADVRDKSVSLRLLWSGDSFQTEPVPPTALFCERLPEATEIERHGRELFAQQRCSRCHRVSDDVLQSASVMPELRAEAPDLIDVGSRLRSDWLAHWLLHPEQVHRRSAMPRFFPEHCTDEQKQQAADLAVYLSSLKAPATESIHRRSTPLPDPLHPNPLPNGERGHGKSTDGERKQGRTADVTLGVVLWEDLGCIACHRLKPPAKGEPLEDDWGRTSLAYVKQKFQSGALQTFLQQPQRHFAWSRMPDFQLSTDEAASLAGLLERESNGEWKTPDTALPQGDAKRGRELFETLGCRQCHRVSAEQPLPTAHMPSVFGKVTARGCLSEREQLPPNVPDFHFDDADRNALLALLRRSESVLASDTPDDISRRFLTELRCAVCHPRDGRMSLLPEVLAEEGEQGKPPEIVPNLTWTGEKLHASWMTALFAGHMGERIRPWLRVRMPSFPARARFLAEGLAREHGLSSQSELRPRIEQELLPIGEYLATRQGGLDCRQCHAIGALPPTGDKNTLIAPGINFAHTRERMRYDFFRRFTLDPPRYDVTTRMPKLAVDGRKTKVTNVLEGDAQRQFEAVWHFLNTVPSSTHDP